jgi:hypothetical protein
MTNALQTDSRSLAIRDTQNEKSRGTDRRSTPGSLGERLEVMRLEHRADRLRRVLDALHRRVEDYVSTGVPEGLRSAIDAFESELSAVSAQLGVQRPTIQRPRSEVRALTQGSPG